MVYQRQDFVFDAFARGTENPFENRAPSLQLAEPIGIAVGEAELIGRSTEPEPYVPTEIFVADRWIESCIALRELIHQPVRQIVSVRAKADEMLLRNRGVEGRALEGNEYG